MRAAILRGCGLLGLVRPVMVLPMLVLSVLAVACGTPSAALEVAALVATPSAVSTAAATPTVVVPAPEPSLTPTPEPTPAGRTAPAPNASPAVVVPAPRDPRPVAALPRVNGSRVVVVDPGHGVEEVGAAANGVVEKHSNLDMALRVEAVLAAQGVRVALTRRADVRAFAGEYQLGTFNVTRRDLQARIDLANESNADVFVSLHSNGAASSAERGIETYYNSTRPFADQSRSLATLVQASVIDEVAAAGYTVTDRGAKDDSCLRGFQGRCVPLFVLGPARVTNGAELVQRDPGAGAVATSSRATEMPGVLVELLFISSPADAALLQSEDVRNAMARGVARGVIEFLNRTPARSR